MKLRRLREWSRRPTTQVAAMLQFAALALAVAYFVVEAEDARVWLANLATAIAALAWTIVIVEQIVQREATQRLWPRVESVMSDLRSRLSSFAESVVIDYSGTHLRTFRPIPADVVQFLDLWLEDVDTHDACHAPGEGDEGRVRSLVVWAGLGLAKELRLIREQDRDVTEPAIVRAIDDYLFFGAQHGVLMQTMDWPSRPPEDRARGFRAGERAIVEQARRLMEVFIEHDSGRRLTFPDPALTASAAAEHSRAVQDRAWYYGDTRLSTSGERMVRMMRLDLTPSEDREELVNRHIGRPRGEAPPEIR